jgi:hypothetical protein
MGWWMSERVEVCQLDRVRLEGIKLREECLWKAEHLDVGLAGWQGTCMRKWVWVGRNLTTDKVCQLLQL